MEDNFNSLHTAGQTIADYLMSGLKDADGRIRVEDLVSAAATVVGERCIDAAGDYSLRSHSFTPGQAMFSERVNELLTGDKGIYDWALFSASTVFGMLYKIALSQGYQASDFPSVENIFKIFAAGVGKTEDWGRAPLSVPQDNMPIILPLRIGFETREGIDRILDKVTSDTKDRLIASTIGLGVILSRVVVAIDKRIALTLAIETVNGMAKTAPMTLEAFKKVAEEK